MRAVVFASIFLFGLLVQLSEGSTWQSAEECPPPSPGLCMGCDCSDGGYRCYSCPFHQPSNNVPEGCYVDNTPIGPDYPDCCPSYRLVCP